MIPIIKEKPRIIIAGPGAGKTHDMVNHILDSIPFLKPNRILSAITFTNAATDSIRERLKDQMQIPPNVFIGTTYRFFNQFIFLPFASVFNYVPCDKCFLDIDVRKIVEKILSGNEIPAVVNSVRQKLLKKLLDEGRVPFEQIATTSAKLMDNSRIRKIVCNKIQFLFQDEFQDTDTTQFRIFNQIKREKKTQMYAVGDPEQYILGFTYNTRGTKKPLFKNIPINKLSSVGDEQKITENRRACTQLVNFINNFNSSVKQKSVVGKIKNSGVFFLNETNLEQIISKFILNTEDIINENKDSKRLFLGYRNKTFNGFIEKYALIQISNDHRRPKSLLKESLDLITSAVQLSSSKFKDIYELDNVGFRKLGIQLLKAIKSEKVQTGSDLISYFKEELFLDVPESEVNLITKLEGLQNLFKIKTYKGRNDFYSTIHKAKGLEAECVLIVSRNQNELEKWLETDYSKRYEDKSDTCRIGYVGFSRAKNVLYIACLKLVDSQIKENLQRMNAKIL